MGGKVNIGSDEYNGIWMSVAEDAAGIDPEFVFLYASVSRLPLDMQVVEKLSAFGASVILRGYHENVREVGAILDGFVKAPRAPLPFGKLLVMSVMWSSTNE